MKGKWKAMIWGGGVRLHCERWLEVWNLKVEQQVWWVVKERMRVRKENGKTSAWGAWWVTMSWDEISSTGDNWVLCGSHWLGGWWWGGGKTFTWWGPLEHLIEKGTGDRFRHHSPLGGSWSHGKINFILIERKIMTEFWHIKFHSLQFTPNLFRVPVIHTMTAAWRIDKAFSMKWPGNETPKYKNSYFLTF